MITVFVLGFVFTFLGYTPPSVLNMTALKIRIHGNKKEFSLFKLGVLIIITFQAFFSIYLSKYITTNPTFVSTLEKTGIIILIALSVYFYKQNQREKSLKETYKTTQKTFLKGLILSSLNVFAIPFFSGIVVLLMNYKLMNSDFESNLLFVFGSVIGAYFILYLYGNYAAKIQEKSAKITKNIYLFLSILTAVMALITLAKFVF